MPPRPPSTWIVRPRLLDRLSASAPIVAVHGPRGVGKSSLLREWADGQAEAVWIEGGVLPAELPAGGTLVIDDVDALTPLGWHRLDAWVSETPGARLRLSARAIVPELARWDIDIVRDLTFTQPEVAEYLALRRSTADPRAVFIATAGLADAVRLVAQAGITRRDQIEHLLGRVYADQALPAAEAALAVPSWLTTGTVAELGGDDRFFDRAERAGAGWWIDDPNHPVFALTAPVRAATLARHPIGDERAVLLRTRAAGVMSQEGAWSAALIEGATIGRLDIVDTALKKGGMALIRARGPILVTVLQSIPSHRLRNYPVTAMALALMYNSRQRHRLKALELLAVALVGMQTAPRNSADRALLRALESIARRLSGIGDGGVRAARTAATALAELGPDDAAELAGLLGDLHIHLGVSLLYGGLTADAREQFELAATQPSRRAVELMAVGGVALTYALEGDVAAARPWIADAQSRPWPDDMVDDYPGSMLRIAQARVALEDGDPEASLAYLDRVWPIIDTIEHWPVLAATRALADIARGNAVEGAESLRALRRRRGGRLRPGRPAARLLDVADALLSLAAGDLVAARRLSVQRSDTSAARLAVARVALADGDDERALRIVADVHPTTPDGRMNYLAVSAATLRRIGRGEEAAVLDLQLDAMRRTFDLRTPLPVIARAGARQVEAPRFVPPKLTPREQVVLAELVRTGNLDEVATRLHVSPNTVKTQRRSLFRKLGATRREEAIAVALAHGLLDNGSLTRDTSAADANASTDPSANSAE